MDEPNSDSNRDSMIAADGQPCNPHNNPNLRRTKLYCKNCGKALYSKKSLYEHTRHCYVASARGKLDGPNDDSRPSSPSSYFKGKRTRRYGTYNIGTSSSPPHLLTEEEAANCLLMIYADCEDPNILITFGEECTASESKEVEDDIPTTPPLQSKPQFPTPTPTISQRKFECCNKVFTSHQALGGHCASHKKVKSCCVTRPKVESPMTENALMEAENNNIDSSSENMAPLPIMPLAECPMQQLPMKKSRLHICSICNREFSSGQALGGHMRCHRIDSKTNSTSAIAATSVVATTSTVITTITEPISVLAPKPQIENSCNIVNLMQPNTQIFPQMFDSLYQPLDLNLSLPTNDLSEISLRLGLPNTVYLQQGAEVKRKTKMNKCTNLSHNYIEEEKASNQNLYDEAESKEVKLAESKEVKLAESKEVKLAELCNLQDMNVGDERSTWLQLGIGFINDRENTIDWL